MAPGATGAGVGIACTNAAKAIKAAATTITTLPRETWKRKYIVEMRYVSLLPTIRSFWGEPKLQLLQLLQYNSEQKRNNVKQKQISLSLSFSENIMKLLFDDNYQLTLVSSVNAPESSLLET